MRYFTVCAAALVLGLAAQSASADETKGFYVGAGLGQFNVEVDDLEDAANVAFDFDSDDTSWKFFGGWRFNPYIAVELDYIDFGGPEDRGVAVDVSGFAPYLIGTLPLGIFEVFAQVGYLFYDVDLSINGTDVDSDSTEDFLYGAGVGVVLFEHLNVRLHYEIIDINEAEDSNALWLTGAWRF